MADQHRVAAFSRRPSLPYPNLELGGLEQPPRLNPYRDEELDDDFREAIEPPENLGPALSRGRQAALIVCLLAGLLISCIDTSIVSTSLVKISEDFQNYADAPWAVLSYLLTYMGFAVFIAKLSDLYGRRNVLIVSWAIFITFSWCCSLAQNMVQLIVFRAFQGVGGSGLYTLAQVGMVEIGPVQRPSVIGALIGATLSISFVLGPIVGGVITHLSGWRWIFNINLPIGMVTMMGLVFCWPHEAEKRPFWETFQSIDFLGGISIFCATSFLVYGIQQGGSEAYVWSDNEVVVAMVLAGLFWVIFFSWQMILGYKHYLHIQPVFPVRLVFQRAFVGAFLVTMCTGFCYIALVVTIPERFQIINNDDPLMAGVHLLPMLGTCAFGSFVAGAACSKRNNSSPVLIVSSALQMIGVGLLSTVNSHDSDVRLQYFYQAIFGLGCGLSFGASTIIAAVESALHGDLATAQGAICQVRVLGGCIGVAICTVIFFNHANQSLKSYLGDDQMAILHHSLSDARFKLGAEAFDRVRSVYADSFAEEAKVMIYICAFMLLSSLWTWKRNPVPLKEALSGQHILHMPEDQDRDRLRLRANRNKEVYSDTEMSEMHMV